MPKNIGVKANSVKDVKLGSQQENTGQEAKTIATITVTMTTSSIGFFGAKKAEPAKPHTSPADDKLMRKCSVKIKDDNEDAERLAHKAYGLKTKGLADLCNEHA